MRKFLAALVAAVLFLLLSIAPPSVEAAPAKKKMPDMENAIHGAEVERVCANGTAITIQMYDRVDTQAAPGYKYIVSFLQGEKEPFLLVVDDDPYDPEALFTIYVDLDRDGYVDYQARKGDAGFPESACDAAAKAKATPKAKRA